MAIGSLIASAYVTSTSDSSTAAAPGVDQTTEQKIVSAYGKLPLRFEQNRGQSDPRVKFISRGAGYSLFLTKSEAVLSLRSEGATAPAAGAAGARAGKVGDGTAVVRMRPVGASPDVAPTAGERLPGVSNYLRGRTPSGWRTGVPGYGRVRYRELYPGVDLVYHGSQGKLEYDFVVAAGADPRPIALALTGARKVSLDRRGDLVLHTAAGKLRQQRPFAYQQHGGNKTRVPARYVLEGEDRVGFVLGSYDRSRPLVIDPVMVYSSYLGGSASDLGGNGADHGKAIAVDSSGAAYLAGATASADFPTEGPKQGVKGGQTDAFVTKISATGAALVYSTYLGGSPNEEANGNGVDEANGIALKPGCASDCEAYVTGSTESTDFPVVNPIQPSFGGGFPDAFVAKLNAAGSVLSYSTYLGGGVESALLGGDDEGRGIAVDASGAAYVIGETNSTDFPTTAPNAAQPVIGGTYDAFVTKVNPAGSAFAYSTFLGGESIDVGYGIAVDASGSAYGTGHTYAHNFPVTTTAFQPTRPNNSLSTPNAFVTKLDATGSTFSYSTYFGDTGSAGVYGQGIATDASGNAYLTGYMDGNSNTFTTPGAFQTASRGLNDAFVAKLDTGAGGAQSRLYSTYLGGASPVDGVDRGHGIAVDPAGNAYVTGVTSTTDFPSVEPIDQPASGTCPGTHAPCPDAYVAKLNATGSGVMFSSYLGGGASEQGFGIAVDPAGNAYVTGQTSSTDFPTKNPFQPGRAGGDDGFISKIAPAADLGLTITDAPDPVVVGEPLTYTLTARNHGSFAAAGVTLRDPLPAGVEFVSASAGCSRSGTTVSCSLGELASGISSEREIVVVATQPNPALLNTATVESAALDRDDSNNAASATTEVRGGPTSPGGGGTGPPGGGPTSPPLANPPSLLPDGGRLSSPAIDPELARSSRLRSCLAKVKRHQGRERRLARRGSARRRARARRHMRSHARRGRRACLKRHGRSPRRPSGHRALSSPWGSISASSPRGGGR